MSNNASNTPAWFSKGHDIENHFPDRPKTGAGNTWRFWLKEGENKRVIFLDDESFRFHEHRLFIDGKVKEYTCTAQSGDPCPLCEIATRQPEGEYTVKARPVVAYTILDLTPYTIKSTGETRSYAKRLLVLSEQSAKTVSMVRNRRKDEEGPDADLTHRKIYIARTSKKSPSTGDNFECGSKVTNFQAESGLDGITDEELKPANYMEEFAPKTTEELAVAAKAFEESKGRGAGATSATVSVDYS